MFNYLECSSKQRLHHIWVYNFWILSLGKMRWVDNMKSRRKCCEVSMGKVEGNTEQEEDRCKVSRDRSKKVFFLTFRKKILDIVWSSQGNEKKKKEEEEEKGLLSTNEMEKAEEFSPFVSRTWALSKQGSARKRALHKMVQLSLQRSTRVCCLPNEDVVKTSVVASAGRWSLFAEALWVRFPLWWGKQMTSLSVDF